MKRSNDETAGLTRRALLARATASALTASAAVAASGCAAVGTRAAALGAPEAVRPLIHNLADPADAISTGPGSDGGVGESEKPNGMHWTTYNRLL